MINPSHMRCLSFIFIFHLVSGGGVSQCSDPEECPETWAYQHRPYMRFDRTAQEHCYPAEATNSNNGQCGEFNPAAPIYYKIVRCGDFLKLAWHLWYGLQRGCDPLGVDSGHDDDWEHITVNFIRDNETWIQDSVTFSQHGGHYTRRNQQQNPDVYVGKIAHGHYDNHCSEADGVWPDASFCPGFCGYWDDLRNDDENSRWLPENIQPVATVTDDQVNRVNNYKYFDDLAKNACEGYDFRCVGATGACGCWRHDHTFPANVVCDI